MLFDSRKSDRPCLKSAFRVTTQKLLYGIVIAAAGTRGIYFSVQVPCIQVLLFSAIMCIFCTYRSTYPRNGAISCSTFTTLHLLLVSPC